MSFPPALRKCRHSPKIVSIKTTLTKAPSQIPLLLALGYVSDFLGLFFDILHRYFPSTMCLFNVLSTLLFPSVPLRYVDRNLTSCTLTFQLGTLKIRTLQPKLSSFSSSCLPNRFQRARLLPFTSWIRLIWKIGASTPRSSG